MITSSYQVYISDPVAERVKQAVNFGAEEKMVETEKVDLIVEVTHHIYQRQLAVTRSTPRCVVTPVWSPRASRD